MYKTGQTQNHNQLVLRMLPKIFKHINVTCYRCFSCVPNRKRSYRKHTWRFSIKKKTAENIYILASIFLVFYYACVLVNEWKWNCPFAYTRYIEFQTIPCCRTFFNICRKYISSIITCNGHYILICSRLRRITN